MFLLRSFFSQRIASIDKQRSDRDERIKLRQHYRDTVPIWSELWRQAKVDTNTMKSNTSLQIEDTTESTKAEIIQGVRMINKVYVDELTEKNCDK